tara:strand:+ start:48773 stop:50983 length:2211 start_codon:yes stop_codon:yes gene_type:complete
VPSAHAIEQQAVVKREWTWMHICSQCKAVLGNQHQVCPNDGAATHAATELPEGAVLGGYRILGEIGDGGMGFVYEATHEVLGRRCAVKLLRPEYSTNQQVVTRFLQEAKAVNLVNNKHIVNVYDYGDDIDGLVYFVMEYLDGDTLSGLMRQYAPMPPALFAHIFSQVLQGLAAAHDNQIIHRDLKFENIFVIAKGNNPLFVKLLDFGVAKLKGEHEVEGLTRVGQLIGTPKFMSPEQFRGKSVDARSDVFSLGILMYAAATGKMPFAGKELADLAVGIIKEKQIPVIERRPSFPQSLSDLVERALEKKPEDRFADAKEFQSALLAAWKELDPESAQITAFLREHVGDPNAEVGLAVFTPPPPADVIPSQASVSQAEQRSANSVGKRTSSRTLGIGIAAALALAGGIGYVALSSDSKTSSEEQSAETSPVGESVNTPATAESAIATSLGGPPSETRALASEAMLAAWTDATKSQRKALVEALATVGSKASSQILVLALNEEPPTALLAAAALEEHGEASANALFDALEGAGPQMTIAVATALANIGDPRANQALLSLMKKARYKTAAAAVLASYTKSPEAKQVLTDVFVETPAFKGGWLDAATGLLRSGDAKARAALIAGLQSDTEEHRMAAASALALAGNSVGQEFLSDIVADARAENREKAAVVLARIGHADAKLFVPVGLMSDDVEAQIAAIAILSRLGGEDLQKQSERLTTFAESSQPALSMAALAALANLPD